jgi:DNA-binding NarL/FixJ family response regulator
VTGQLASAILNVRIEREAGMVSSSRLIIFGNSVFLAGIKVQLEQVPALELITMEAAQTKVVDQMRACQPQAVIFDLAMGYPDFAVSLLHEQPGLLLIGVDPNSNELLVLSSKHKRAVAVADLLKVIQKEGLEI